jgi:hypothetical protein
MLMLIYFKYEYIVDEANRTEISPLHLIISFFF